MSYLAGAGRHPGGRDESPDLEEDIDRAAADRDVAEDAGGLKTEFGARRRRDDSRALSRVGVSRLARQRTARTHRDRFRSAPEDERPPVEVRDQLPSELAAAVAVLASGMRDNPVNVAAYGEDPERRRRSLERMFATLFPVAGAERPICALAGGAVVAVTGVAPPGTCQPTTLQRLRFVPSMIAIGPGPVSRVAKWLAAWGEREPDQPHSYVGPVAVEPHLQGRAIGSRLMAEHRRRLDAAGEVSYLETDKRENARLLRTPRGRVLDEADVIGVRNWFMIRQPQRSG